MKTIINHDYPIWRLRAERDAGLYLCRCDDPAPVRWALYDIVECQQCYRKVAS